MNDNESILAELRRIGAWADMQRKITKWSLGFVAIFVPGLIIFGIVMENRLKTTMEDIGSPQKTEKPTWSDVDRNVRRANPDEAIRVGEELIQKMPQYAEGHYRLAAAYLAEGKLEQARQHFAQAFHLFPSKENESSLTAIERRIKEGTLPLKVRRTKACRFAPRQIERRVPPAPAARLDHTGP
jgi:tetratricopeptide (TPR) repeat protein